MREPATRPRRRFGQHFLEPAWVVKVVAAVGPDPADVFLEVGPGRGALTAALAARVHRVVGFEIDRDLAAALQRTSPANVMIVNADFLSVSEEGFRAFLETAGFDRRRPIRAAGNLPYNVATPILLRLADLAAADLVGDATVMLQREVADRLLARPGTRDYGALTVALRHRAEVRRVMNLPAGAFRPAPKVQSSLVHLRFRPPCPPATRPDVLAAVVRAIFTRRRKTLANALRAYPAVTLPPAAALAHAGLDPARRPETLDVDELVRLSEAYASLDG